VASGAAASSTNLELAALRRVLRRAAEEGLLDHEKAKAAAHVKNTSSLGVRVGNWLTPEQAKALLLAPDENTLKGKRDGAIFGLLVGCGLRRAEFVSLVVKEVQMSRRSLDDSTPGRQGQTRSPRAGAKDRLDLWTEAAKLTDKKRRYFGR
jgi:integrase/recombinase XerD